MIDVKITINVLLAPLHTDTTWQWHVKWSSNFEPINFRDEVVHWQIIIMIISTFTPGVASQKDWIGQKHLKALWIVNTSAGNLLKFCSRAVLSTRVPLSCFRLTSDWNLFFVFIVKLRYKSQIDIRHDD